MITASIAVLWIVVAYLAGLGVLALLRPATVCVFLSGFAQTTRANLTESGLRLLAGAAFIGASSHTRDKAAALVVGSFLAISALMMLLLPDIHRRFATRSTTRLFDFLPLFGLASLMLAAALAWFIGPPDFKGWR